MAAQLHGIFTIGHSTHDLEKFVGLLKQQGVAAVADVRSAPYSRRQPQFNREPLARSLSEHGVKYIYFGKELGARSDDSTCYQEGRIQFRKLAKTELFRSGIKRIVDGSQRMRVALMCAEKDPLDCHRMILVSRELVALGKDVNHILEDGQIESHQVAMSRLICRLGLSAEDLFRTPGELDDDAYAAQEKRIAYVESKHTSRTHGGHS